MKKKKLLIPLAIMSLSCGLAVGALTGCGGHEHNYTKWGYDANEHWQICEEDNEISEKKPHSFGEDGKCECGAEKPALSTASGQVKLLKLGKYMDDYTGISIDTGDDDGNDWDIDSKTGKFTITDLQVGKSYTLSISKAGYSTYTTTLEVVKGEDTVVGGAKGCVLQYDAFSHGMHVGDDWNGNYGTPSKIDKSHVNDAEPYFTIGEGTGDFYVYTKDSYDTVTASVTYKDGLTWGVNDRERGNQGIRLVFEDGKASMIRIEKMANGKFKAQWVGGQEWEEKNILGDWDFGDGEAHYNPFSAEIEAQYKETGIELKLVRNGSAVYAYVNDEKMGEQMLPAEYATQKCRVALAAGHVNGGQTIPFSISESIPEEEFASELTFEKGTLPEGVEASLDKTDGYKRGDFVTLSVNLTDESVITALTYNNKSILENFEDGKVSFVLTEAANALTVTVEEKQYVDLTDVAITGKKYDVAGSSLKDGTVVTLKGLGGLEDIELTLAEGKVSKTHVVRGTYTAYAEGYKPAEVVVGANGIEGGITLEYDSFDIAFWDKEAHDYTSVNDEHKIGCDNKTLNVLTKDLYTDVSVSLTVKDANSRNGNDVQGIWLKFEDGKYLMLRSAIYDDQYRLTFIKGIGWGDETFLDEEINFYYFNTAEAAAIKGDGIALRLVRKGGMLYTFLGEKCVYAYELPEAYKTQKAQVGFWDFDSAANAVWDFDITTTLPELAGTAELTKNFPEDVEGIAAALDKTEFTLGDELTLTVTLPEGYIIAELTVNGESYLEQFKNGKLAFLASTNEIAVSVKVIEGEYADIEANVTGKKYDVNGNSIADGTAVTLIGQGGIGTVKLTVTDGKIVKQKIVQGVYAVEVEGYKPVNVTVGENGIEEAITLEYDGFGMLPPNWDAEILDFSQINDGIIKANGNGSKSLDIVTKDIFTDVAVTINVKDSVAGVVQGIVLKFENDKYILLNFKKDQKLIQYRNEWGGMWSVFGDTWVEHAITNADIDAFDSASGIDLKLVRKGGMLYAFLGDRFIAANALPEGYETMKAQVGFFAFDVKANASWEYEITQTLPDLASAVKLTNNIPEGATGVTATVDKTACTLGDEITLTVTLPAEGYVVGDITVNGTSVLKQLNEGKITFTAMQAQSEVVVTVLAATAKANIDVEITGKKYDVKGNAIADGTAVTLVGLGGLANATGTVTDGKLTLENVAQGMYTVEIEGYRPLEVTVGANGIAEAIVLEYQDAFDLVKNWGWKDLDRQNDGYLTGGNDQETLLTNAMYKDASFTMYLSGAYRGGKINGGNQGIVFRFDDGKYVTLRMEGKQKIQFAEPYDWQDGGKADGAGWKDLIFFKRGDEYLQAYAAGTLKMTLVRDGATFYAFLNDQYIGYQTVDAKYETADARVGIFWQGTTNGVDKTWKYEMSETLPELTSTVKVTNNIPEGAGELAATVDKTSGMLGDIITLTVPTLAEGYIIGDITVNGTSVLKQLNEGKITFTAVKTQNEVVFTVLAETQVDVDVSVTGKKYDVVGNSIADGTAVTLVGLGGLANATGTITDGKLTLENVAQGMYTVEVEGYRPVEVTVGANGIEEAIVLEYQDAFNLVKGWGSKNLDEQNDGYLKGSNECETLLSNAMYNDVAVTMYLSGDYWDNKIGGGNQGITFRFNGGGYVNLRMEGRQKIQFAEPDWNQDGSKADGAGWNDLIFFKEGDEYLKAYDAGTLKLTLVRKGATFYAFLNDQYIGKQTVDAKYENVSAQVGIYWASTTNGAEKIWKVEISKTLPELPEETTTPDEGGEN